MKISVILFIYWPEEAAYVSAALDSVKDWADEIIVIDNGANSQTKAIVSQYTKKIYLCKLDNFAARHNLGAVKAAGDWLLFLDADERISQNLASEMRQELSSPSADAYQLRRVNFFLGKMVRYGDRYPDLVTRLIKKSNLINWTGEIHESSHVSGKIGHLTGPLYHLTHRDISSMLEKTRIFSEHEAKLRLAADHPPIVWWRLVRVTLSEFFWRVIRLSGWRQGTEGWIDGISQAFSLFVVYARLWELQRQPNLGERYAEIDRQILSGEL